MNNISKPLLTVREQSPLVHCITNFVAMNTCANVLLASGASPAMVHAAEEAPEFVKISSALTVNIGTLSYPWLDSMLATTRTAHENNIPWVLDPVAVGATSFRREACQELLRNQPTIIRGNASEIMALAGVNSQSKGADSGDLVCSAQDSARALAQAADVVIVTGEVDFITDGEREWMVENGHALMPKVTALGCSLTGLLGAFIAAYPDDLAFASVSVLCFYGLAGEIGAETANGTGSFYINFLDTLGNIDADTLDSRARFKAL